MKDKTYRRSLGIIVLTFIASIWLGGVFGGNPFAGIFIWFTVWGTVVALALLFKNDWSDFE